MEILGIFRDRPEDDPPPEPQSGWRRFLSRASVSDLDDSEFRPEPTRPKRNYYRLALGVALSILVVTLGRHVGKQALPLLSLVKEDLPSPSEQIQAVLAQLHIGETEHRRPARPPEVVRPRKRHHVSREAEEEAPVAALPPYKGTVRAQLTITPLYSYRPFQVELKDAHTRKKMEVGEPKPLTVDIDDPEPAMLRIAGSAEPAPPPAAFSVNVDLSGPEADRIADVLEPGSGGAQSDSAVRKQQDQRSVGLAAVVDKNGRVASLRRVNGSSALAQAAIDTVRRTRYKPFLENGRAVEMQTFITVEFTIPQS